MPRVRAAPNDPQPPVDDVDRALLELLARDARITNQRLADRVGVAPSTALARLRSLRDRGVIRGFHAEVDLAALGRPLQALIAVRLAVHARDQIDDFTATVRQLPGVVMVFHLTGVTDYLVWVAAADAQDLREFVVDHLATHPSVAHAETSLIYEHQRGPGIWGRRTRHEPRRSRRRPRDHDLHRDERARAANRRDQPRPGLPGHRRPARP